MADETLVCPDCPWQINKSEVMAAAKLGNHRRKEHGYVSPNAKQKNTGTDRAPRRPASKQAMADVGIKPAGRKRTAVATDMTSQVAMLGKLMFMWDPVCGGAFAMSAEAIGDAADDVAREFPSFGRAITDSGKWASVIGLAVAVGEPLLIVLAHHGILPAAFIPAQLLDAEARVHAAEAQARAAEAAYPMPPADTGPAAPPVPVGREWWEEAAAAQAAGTEGVPTVLPVDA